MKLKVAPFILLLTTMLSSCNGVYSFSEYHSFVEDRDTHELEEYDNYYKPAAFSSITYKNHNNEDQVISSYDDVYSHRDTRYRLSTLGEQNILVVPIFFIDNDESVLPKSTKKVTTDLANAFFGEPSKTAYESVASFYNKSSYGKLRIKGSVSSWCTLPKTSKEYSTNKEASLKEIYNYVLDWYKVDNDITKYYINGEEEKGVAMFIVYAENYVLTDSHKNFYWAFTLTNPNPICWASAHFMYLEGKNKIDSRTFIHEVGHMFGLDDYYDKNTQSSAFLGKLDMMDSSVGDHNSYSKMLFEWSRPYVVTDSGTITIRPTSLTGDFILIKDEWNGSMMDEYLMIEFYSPIGLNRKYGEYIINKPFVRVSHVDSRVGIFKKSLTYSREGYINEVTPSSSDYYLRIGNENLQTAQNKLIHVLTADEKSLENDTVNYSRMFHQGDTFGINNYEDYRFNDKTLLGYTFKIKTLTNLSVSIEFNKK